MDKGERDAREIVLKMLNDVMATLVQAGQMPYVPIVKFNEAGGIFVAPPKDTTAGGITMTQEQLARMRLHIEKALNDFARLLWRDAVLNHRVVAMLSQDDGEITYEKVSEPPEDDTWQ